MMALHLLVHLSLECKLLVLQRVHTSLAAHLGIATQGSSSSAVRIAELLIGGAEPQCPNPVVPYNGIPNIFFNTTSDANELPQGTPGISILQYFDLHLSVSAASAQCTPAPRHCSSRRPAAALQLL